MMGGPEREDDDEDVEFRRSADRIHSAPSGERTAIGEVRRKAGVSDATFCNWREKYGGLVSSKMKRPKQLDDENSKLKTLVADLSLDKAVFSMSKKGSYDARPVAGCG